MDHYDTYPTWTVKLTIISHKVVGQGGESEFDFQDPYDGENQLLKTVL